MKIAFLLVTFLLSSIGFAISEQDYIEKWENEVFPFFLKKTQFDYMISHDDQLKLLYGILLNETAQSNHKLIVLLPGRSEPIYKYSELTYDLYQKGYSIALLDHRGQGGSERSVSNPEKGHVKSFKYYVKDIEKFMDSIVMKLGMKKTFLIAHSMGASASLMLMADRSDLFDKAILSSPMLKPNTGKYPPSVALTYMTGLRLIGKGEDWAPGEKGYETPVFEGNRVTGSRVRRAMVTYLYETYDEFKMGGVTVDWVATSIGTNNRFVFKYRKIKTPIMILQAGDDSVVYTKRQNKLCRKARNCQLIHYPSAKHEILIEVDKIRNDVMKKTFNFFGQ